MLVPRVPQTAGACVSVAGSRGVTARLQVVVARIETLALDAIVNAANTRLVAGAGVDGAIRSAAGPQLGARLANAGGLAEGEALITPGFRLPARFVIHTVAPVYAAAGAHADKCARLASCYRECLLAADRAGLAEIAFPALGTGAFGWPKPLGRDIAIETVSEQLPYARGVTRVVFCCFVEADGDLYRTGLGVS
ncbi:MAG: O-acetyl-ADP-ribose deacetylase [Alphaproteobacteria bacterium]|nr:O-acetyl-ADP-ribose deacetylase [Alphaproteobacteria bacterium]